MYKSPDGRYDHWKLTPEQLARVEPQVDMREYGYDRSRLRRLRTKHIERISPLHQSKLRRALGGWSHLVSESDLELFDELEDLESAYQIERMKNQNRTFDSLVAN